MAVNRPPGPPNDRFGTNHLESLRHDLPAFFQRCARDYGDVFWFRLGPHPCYHFLHPEHLLEILVRKAHCFRKPRRFKQVFGRYEGNGLIVSDGTDWLAQRRWIQPSLARTPELPPAEPAASLASDMLQSWAGRRTIELNGELRPLALKLAVQVLFSAVTASELTALREAIDILQEWSLPEFHRLVVAPRWWPWWGPTPARNALRTLDEFIARRLSERQRQTCPADDLLEALLRNRKECPPSGSDPRTQLRDQLVTLLLSAYETMSAFLIWSVWILARHPATQQQILAELASTPPPAGTSSPAPHESDLLDRSLLEVLRLYPPVYLLTREVFEPVEIGGYTLEPGSQVYLSVWLTQRDSRWFERPEEFDPGRFEIPRGDAIRHGAWLPFGLGPRGCPGKPWAMEWAREILTQILRQFTLSLPPSAPLLPRLAWKLSLHPAEDLNIILEQRPEVSSAPNECDQASAGQKNCDTPRVE